MKEERRKDLKETGLKCKILRISLGIKQKQVAKETGYSLESISKFENGCINNMVIFKWYLEHGLDENPK